MHRKLVNILTVAYSCHLYAMSTQLNLYRPFADSNKHVHPVIASIKTGHCSQMSKRIIRKDAWNCTTEDGQTYDPCFSKRFGVNTTVVCPESPWSARSVEIRLNVPIDNHYEESLDMSRTLPWAIELKSGERCLSVDSNQYFEDLPVHFQCHKNSVLIGEPHRCKEVWTIIRHDEKGVSVVEIDRAWF